MLQRGTSFDKQSTPQKKVVDCLEKRKSRDTFETTLKQKKRNRTMTKLNYALFKPNKKNTGHMAQFNTNVNEYNGQQKLSCFFRLTKQAGWNDQNNTGSFKDNMKNPDKYLSILITPEEAGEIVRTINRLQDSAQGYHQNQKGTSQFWFSYNEKEYDGKTKKYFTLIMVKNGDSENKYWVNLALGEAEILRLFLEKYITESLVMKGETYGGNGNEGGGQQSYGFNDAVPASNDGSAVIGANKANSGGGSAPPDEDDLPF